MRTAGQVIAAPTHDSRPVSGSCDLDEDRTGVQALGGSDAQGGLRDTHVPARALTVRLRLPVQVYARCGRAQGIGRGLEAHRPSGAHESLGFTERAFDATSRPAPSTAQRWTATSSASHRGKRRSRRRSSPSSRITIKPEGGGGHPHGRARPHDEGDTPQRRGDVHAVALLRGDLATAECCTDTKILLKFSCNTSGMLTGGRHDDDGASGGHGRGHGVRQARAQIRRSAVTMARGDSPTRRRDRNAAPAGRHATPPPTTCR